MITVVYRNKFPKSLISLYSKKDFNNEKESNNFINELTKKGYDDITVKRTEDESKLIQILDKSGLSMFDISINKNEVNIFVKNIDSILNAMRDNINFKMELIGFYHTKNSLLLIDEKDINKTLESFFKYSLIENYILIQ